MKTILKYFFLPVGVYTTLLIFSSFINRPVQSPIFPYKKAGLTERQAAAHLLSRFTYGARPGDIDAALKVGLEKWFRQQLQGTFADDSLKVMFKNYDAINLTNNEVSKMYPNGGQVLRMAIRDGVIHKDSVSTVGKKEYREQLMAYMKKNGYRPQAELYRQLINQKILRAAYSENQIREVLTDFWFNHFNVSLTKGQSAEFIPAYERDVIRPNVFGRFENLILTTAKSPAMLTYLDNVASSGIPENLPKPANPNLQNRIAPRVSMNTDTSMKSQVLARVQQRKKARGLNENYAREVMELHTLGVDGGYTQEDVTQAARILTGWTIYPMENGYGSAARNNIEKMGSENFAKRGFIHEGDFLFAANRHDMGAKVVLGKEFPANRGYEEGVELLKLLANHPSAAKFISGKLATRFVNDNPPIALIDKMSETFIKSKGIISEVLSTMVLSEEFWSKEALREKTKSPFELAISAVRSLDAEIVQPYQLYIWISRMGQKIYSYQAPTGFPDKGQYWINTGSLLNRMNFGLALASQRIPGVRVNLAALNKNREPESSDAALTTYARLIMPERDLSQTIERLRPILNDPELQKKVAAAAEKNAPAQGKATMTGDDPLQIETPKDKSASGALNGKGGRDSSAAGSNTMLAQVVGVILGSPEFQRK